MITRKIRNAFSREFKSGRRKKAIALITVMGTLALTTVLFVSMLTFASTEHAGAVSYASGNRAREFGEIATNIVISQIRRATSQTDTAWASQPGALRTYGETGTFETGYKLFSDTQMTVDSEELLANDAPPSDWDSDLNKPRYTDLNEPIIRDGDYVFPIADPRAKGDIEGFSYDLSAVGGSPTGGGTSLPMPVEWLYILEDGTVGGVDETGAFMGAIPATKQNPIVGRVAFWSDEDTNKININTAAEPTFWDTPRTDGDDRLFARFQPTNREYQRYPGHPATTALSPVLKPEASLSAEEKEEIYDIIPRVAPGGSKGATISYLAEPDITPDGDRLFGSLDEFVFPPDRNWSGSAHDPLVSPNRLRRSRFFLTAHSRAPEVTLFGTPRVSIWPLAAETRYNERSRTGYDQLIAFCSTIGEWDPQRDIALDMATEQREDYFFRRQNEDAPDGDFYMLRNQQLYSYLQDLTTRAIPGFGGNFLTKYGPDRDQILTEIYDYIRCTNIFDDSLGTAGEGTGGVTNSHRQFSDGRGGGGHGKVTPTYIPENDTLGFGRFFTISEASLHFICCGDGKDGAPGGGQGTDPITGDYFRSNYPPLSDPEASRAASFYGEAEGIAGDDPTHPGYQSENWNRSLDEDTPLLANERRLQAMLFFEFFNPMQGWTACNGEFEVKVSGLENLSAGGKDLGFPDSGSVRTIRSMGSCWHERSWGGYNGFRGFLVDRRMPARAPLDEDSSQGSKTYPFIGIPVTVTVDGDNLEFSGGEITVEFRAGGAPSADNQTIHLKFPGGEIPMPELVQSGTPDRYGSTGNPSYLNAPITTPDVWWTFRHDGSFDGEVGRLRHISRNPSYWNGSRHMPAAGAFIRREDSVISLIPEHGDYRLTALKRDVPDTHFVPHDGYGDLRLAHNLRTTAGPTHIQGGYQSLGKLVTNATYSTWTRPDFPKTWEDKMVSGDFDNGVSVTSDGPYANKPDDGNTKNLNAGEDPYFYINWSQDAGGPTYFSPNRQVPSPGMFGSLPTGVKADVPWRTLLFRPQATHFGANDPPDHLLLDLFWMPVVEPYAISEHFSTAGKVNLNHQILPFKYIERTTALRAVFGDEKILSVPAEDGAIYKRSNANSYRKKIDHDETLKQWTTRFDKGEIFKSATEICNLHLVPQDTTLEGMETHWETYSMTGENARERNYANLYPRLTTQSNTYRVHIRAEVIKKSRSSSPNVFDPARDTILAAYRGSSLIERYIDPKDPDIPNYATSLPGIPPRVRPESLESFYKFRVISQRKFQ